MLCSGKLCYDLIAAGANEEVSDRVAVVRLELLYAFPEAELRAALGAFPGLQEIVWAQEEPSNLGGWSYLRPRLIELSGDLPVRFVGRASRASRAEGHGEVHTEEQARIVREALAS